MELAGFGVVSLHTKSGHDARPWMALKKRKPKSPQTTNNIE